MLSVVTPLDPKAKAEALKALLPGFFKHRAEDVGEMRRALVSEDFARIAALGHKLRGNGASFGFPELSELGERLENAANRADYDAVLAEVDALEERIAVLSEP